MGFLKDMVNNIREMGIPMSLIFYVLFGYLFIWLSMDKNLILINFLTYVGLSTDSAQMIKDSSKIFGQTVITSGIATSILRTNFFTNILQKQLFKVVYTEDLLKNRKDIIDIWSRVSKTLYSNKFPDIADSINETITRKYFPIEKHYYYYKTENSIKIKVEDKEKKLVKTTETQSGVIKIHRDLLSYYNPFDKRHNIHIMGSIDKYHALEADKTKVKVSKGKFNTKELDVEFSEKTVGNKYQYEFSFNIKEIHGDTINYEYTIEKMYHLKNEIDLINVAFNNIHYDYTLYLNYDPSELTVRFIDLGTADNYRDVNKNCPDGQILKKYDGVIFPGQGYCFAIQII